ncbi:hypothetical protein [Flavobacterium hydrocarbonoxydans]|uniref:hypothetical protein n=1 Tax=Flavobacterium hydrocarbonoxydans TaxID=2683249 RepID=UPI001E4C97D7|nr:hypothetical protein [Flavobacterium hydrocarbonoxydans]
MGKFLRTFRFPNVFMLLLIVFVSCALLICINFFTIKILSANRVYVNGESLYSKGQNNATIHLISYLYTQNKKEWDLFRQELEVPQGDRDARVELSNGDETETIKEGFRAGRNNEKDLDDAIWLFRNFKNVSFFLKQFMNGNKEII